MLLPQTLLFWRTRRIVICTFGLCLSGRLSGSPISGRLWLLLPGRRNLCKGLASDWLAWEDLAGRTICKDIQLKRASRRLFCMCCLTFIRIFMNLPWVLVFAGGGRGKDCSSQLLSNNLFKNKIGVCLWIEPGLLGLELLNKVEEQLHYIMV